MTSVDVVSVNWNSGRQLAECLASLAATDRTRVTLGRVVVVDNASSDGSAGGIDRDDLPLEVLANPTNRGFAAACNQGARAGQSPYILFLNPDTRLEFNSLAAPLAFLESAAAADVGICGIQLVDAEGKVARSCARFPTARQLAAAAIGLDRLLPGAFPGFLMREWDHRDSRRVDHVIGAFYLVRRSLFERLGGFDERYFVYLEDLDFSLRAREAGWHSYFLASARAFHRGGGTSDQVRAERLLYLLRSRLHYAHRHFSPAGAAAVRAATLGVEPLVRVVAALGGGAPRQAGDTIRAYWMLATSAALPPRPARDGLEGGSLRFRE
ncbi:MAG TPA: glycosyltransferase family 2 protein [Gemmatimonadales bacterium]|nr:glycosyltransferase family 2 protein [Gemmatimonadales bacterium]